MLKVAVLSALAVCVVACGGAAPPTASPLPSPTGVATPSARPTDTPPPTATPLVTPEPAALDVAALDVTARVRRGSTARVRVQTEPGAECSISVIYDSGPSQADGLKPKTTNRRGRATWRWRVGNGTARGTYPITVSCTNEGSRGSLELEFTVR